jgi:hypothetical protein
MQMMIMNMAGGHMGGGGGHHISEASPVRGGVDFNGQPKMRAVDIERAVAAIAPPEIEITVGTVSTPVLEGADWRRSSASGWCILIVGLVAFSAAGLLAWGIPQI